MLGYHFQFYSLSFRPARFSSSSMASSSSVRFASMFPMSFSTFAESRAVADAFVDDAVTAPAASAMPVTSVSAGWLPMIDVGGWSPIAPIEELAPDSVGDGVVVALRWCGYPPTPPPLPMAAWAATVTVVASEADDDDDEEESDGCCCSWLLPPTPPPLLLLQVIPLPPPGWEANVWCGSVRCECSVCGWCMVPARCLMVPALSLAKGKASIESMLDVD